MLFDSVTCFFKHKHEPQSFWNEVIKELKDEQKPNHLKFWSGWEALLEVMHSNLLLRAELISTGNGEVWLGLAESWRSSGMENPATSPGNLFWACIGLLAVFFFMSDPNTPYQSLGPIWWQWEKICLYPFVELLSSSYGIPLGHSVAAALSEWASLALPASPAISSAPSKGLLPFLVLSKFLNIPREMQGPKLDI